MRNPSAGGNVRGKVNRLTNSEHVRDRQEKIIALLKKSNFRPDVRFTLGDAIKQAET